MSEEGKPLRIGPKTHQMLGSVLPITTTGNSVNTSTLYQILVPFRPTRMPFRQESQLSSVEILMFLSN